MDAIVAVYADWGIGAKGTQPLVIPADRRRYRELTMGAAVLLGGLIAEISSFDDAFILGLIMLFFSAVLYMKVIGPQYEKNKLR